MSRKLMAMMLAIGLVVGLAGGFAGGYFYNNFKAEEGGTVGTGAEGSGSGNAQITRKPGPELVELRFESVAPAKTFKIFTEIVGLNGSPYSCPNGWTHVEPMPFFLHPDTAISLDKKSERLYHETELVERDRQDSIEFGDEKIYEYPKMEISSDGKSKIITTKLLEYYKKVRPDTGYIHGEKLKEPPYHQGPYYNDNTLLGAMDRKDHPFDKTPKTLCSAPTEAGGGQ